MNDMSNNDQNESTSVDPGENHSNTENPNEIKSIVHEGSQPIRS